MRDSRGFKYIVGDLIAFKPVGRNEVDIGKIVKINSKSLRIKCNGKEITRQFPMCSIPKMDDRPSWDTYNKANPFPVSPPCSIKLDRKAYYKASTQWREDLNTHIENTRRDWEDYLENNYKD